MDIRHLPREHECLLITTEDAGASPCHPDTVDPLPRIVTTRMGAEKHHSEHLQASPGLEGKGGFGAPGLEGESATGSARGRCGSGSGKVARRQSVSSICLEETPELMGGAPCSHEGTVESFVSV